MTTWRALLTEAATYNGECFDNIIHIAIEKGMLDRKFDAGFGCVEGFPFTAWSERFVYFPVDYDGAESVGSVPRNPSEIRTNHFGGGG